MKLARIIVRAIWDDEALVWVASSADIDGLSIESPTLEGLNRRVLSAVSNLLELNGTNFDTAQVPVHILAEQLAIIPNPRAA